MTPAEVRRCGPDTETTEQRIVRIRRERVTTLLRALPDPRGYAPGLLRDYADRLDAFITDDVMRTVRFILGDVMREPAHASAARVALDALGALWAVL